MRAKRIVALALCLSFGLFLIQVCVMYSQVLLTEASLRHRIAQASLLGSSPERVVSFLNATGISHGSYRRMEGHMWSDFDRTISAGGDEVGDIPFRVVPVIWRIGIR